jgi:predicted metal-dependent hydrolase
MNKIIKIILIILIILLFLTIAASIVCKKVHEHYNALYVNDPKIDYLKSKLERIFPEIHLVEIYKGDKSYTIDKNKIFLCLYDENKKYYPDNFLMYVLLHELAHYYNKEDVGHTPAFYAKFNQYLKEAEKEKIYDPSIPFVDDYCPGEEKSSGFFNTFVNLF